MGAELSGLLIGPELSQREVNLSDGGGKPGRLGGERIWTAQITPRVAGPHELVVPLGQGRKSFRFGVGRGDKIEITRAQEGLDFGEVYPGQKLESTVHPVITSGRGGTLHSEIQELAPPAKGPGADDLRGAPIGVGLEPIPYGEESGRGGPDALRLALEVPVDQRPARYGGVLRVWNETDEARMPVSAAVQRPELSVRPEKLDLGNVRRGEEGRGHLSLELSGGRQPLRVTLQPWQKEGTPRAPGFYATGLERRIDLRASEPERVDVRILTTRETDPGTYRSSLLIEGPFHTVRVPVTVHVAGEPLPLRLVVIGALWAAAAVLLALLIYYLIRSVRGVPVPAVRGYLALSALMHILLLLLSAYYVLEETVKKRVERRVAVRAVRMEGSGTPSGSASERQNAISREMAEVAEKTQETDKRRSEPEAEERETASAESTETHRRESELVRPRRSEQAEIEEQKLARKTTPGPTEERPELETAAPESRTEEPDRTSPESGSNPLARREAEIEREQAEKVEVAGTRRAAETPLERVENRRSAELRKTAVARKQRHSPETEAPTARRPDLQARKVAARNREHTRSTQLARGGVSRSGESKARSEAETGEVAPRAGAGGMERPRKPTSAPLEMARRTTGRTSPNAVPSLPTTEKTPLTVDVPVAGRADEKNREGRARAVTVSRRGETVKGGWQAAKTETAAEPAPRAKLSTRARNLSRAILAAAPRDASPSAVRRAPRVEQDVAPTPQVRRRHAQQEQDRPGPQTTEVGRRTVRAERGRPESTAEVVPERSAGPARVVPSVARVASRRAPAAPAPAKSVPPRRSAPPVPESAPEVAVTATSARAEERHPEKEKAVIGRMARHDGRPARGRKSPEFSDAETPRISELRRREVARDRPARRPGKAELASRGDPGQVAGLGDDASGGRLLIGTARHGGDWSCDRTAMPNLAYQFQERTGLTIETEGREVGLAQEDLFQCAFVFLTGHKDFRLREAAIRNLRRYIRSGGALWVNDSTHEGSETFDRAARRELRKIFPDRALEEIPMDSSLFSSCYNLRGGYRGYRIPPGDKYREDRLRGIRLDGRWAVIYTRNDYGDGLEIDPHTHPLMDSLTDLSPREMQEGSIRMGMNVAFYFLRSRRGDSEEAQLALRGLSEKAAASVPEAERRRRGQLADRRAIRLPDLVEAVEEWRVMEKGWKQDETTVLTPQSDGDAGVTVKLSKGTQGKNVIGRFMAGDLSDHRWVILSVESEMSAGARVALGISTGEKWNYYESAPRYIRPGENPLVTFDLQEETFKTAGTDWEYTTLPKELERTQALYLLFYPISGGTVRVGQIKVAR